MTKASTFRRHRRRCRASNRCPASARRTWRPRTASTRPATARRRCRTSTTRTSTTPTGSTLTSSVPRRRPRCSRWISSTCTTRTLHKCRPGARGPSQPSTCRNSSSHRCQRRSSHRISSKICRWISMLGHKTHQKSIRTRGDQPPTSRRPASFCTRTTAARATSRWSIPTVRFTGAFSARSTTWWAEITATGRTSTTQPSLRRSTTWRRRVFRSSATRTRSTW